MSERFWERVPPCGSAAFKSAYPTYFFVRTENEAVITQKATLGTPNLVIEIVSPNDRKSDTNATEADYQTLGVLEIVYIDQRRRLVRILRKSPVGYSEETLTGQPLTLRSLQNLTLEWDWLFVEPRPDEVDTCCPCTVKNNDSSMSGPGSLNSVATNYSVGTYKLQMWEPDERYSLQVTRNAYPRRTF